MSGKGTTNNVLVFMCDKLLSIEMDIISWRTAVFSCVV